ncbi:MAG: hypothetical protein ACXAB5_07025 [Candidatus Thorarchaeota archaeon]|jgi:hypothetical protein
MNNEEEDMQIVFKPEAAKLQCFKTIALFVVIFLPLLLIYWFQEILRPLYGNPTPLAPVYLGMFVLLIGWYVFGFGILLPWASRRIDAFMESRSHRNKDSESYD